MVLLCLLGITFSIGSKTDTSLWETHIPRRRKIITTSPVASEQHADASAATSGAAHPPSSSVRSSCAGRRIYRGGPGDAEDAEQVCVPTAYGGPCALKRQRTLEVELCYVEGEGSFHVRSACSSAVVCAFLFSKVSLRFLFVAFFFSAVRCTISLIRCRE